MFVALNIRNSIGLATTGNTSSITFWVMIQENHHKFRSHLDVMNKERGWKSFYYRLEQAICGTEKSACAVGLWDLACVARNKAPVSLN